MRRTGMWLGLMAMAVCANTATAITTDGNWSDWFSYNATLSLNTWNDGAVVLNNSQIRTVNDPENDAFGGQPFDIEQLFYFYDDADPNASTGGTLHIGMVTGFAPEGATDVNGNLYRAGDFFIGFGQGTGTPLAIGIAPNEARFQQAYFGGGIESNVNVGLGGDFADADPWRSTFTGGSDETGVFTPVVRWGGDGQSEATLAGGPAYHYFLELSIAIDSALEDIITDEINGGISLHWTMECGNDYITVADTTPFVPIPEPTTMVLLGMGVLGMALRARRPIC